MHKQHEGKKLWIDFAWRRMRDFSTMEGSLQCFGCGFSWKLEAMCILSWREFDWLRIYMQPLSRAATDRKERRVKDRKSVGRRSWVGLAKIAGNYEREELKEGYGTTRSTINSLSYGRRYVKVAHPRGRLVCVLHSSCHHQTQIYKYFPR